MDLETRSAAERQKWAAQFGSRTPGSYSSAVTRAMGGLHESHDDTLSLRSCASAFVVACSARGKKVAIYPVGNDTSADALRQWITRLLGGEITQSEAIPDLFS